jgi:hypothetical protein
LTTAGVTREEGDEKGRILERVFAGTLTAPVFTRALPYGKRHLLAETHNGWYIAIVLAVNSHDGACRKDLNVALNTAHTKLPAKEEALFKCRLSMALNSHTR